MPLEMCNCNCADKNQAHHCDPCGLRVQEQPYFWFAPASLFSHPLVKIVMLEQTKNKGIKESRKIKEINEPVLMTTNVISHPFYAL